MGDSDSDSSEESGEVSLVANPLGRCGKQELTSSEEEVKIEAELKQVASRQKIEAELKQVVREKKKMMVIEIKGKMPPGKEAVFALNREKVQEKLAPAAGSSSSIAQIAIKAKESCAGVGSHDNVQSSPEKARESQGSLSPRKKIVFDEASIVRDLASPPKDLYPHRKTLTDTRERLAFTQKSGDFGRKLQIDERERLVDFKERIRERRDRYNAVRGRNLADQREANALSSFRDTLAEQIKHADLNKHDGVLKVSDRSICDNGCEALLRVIKNNDKLTELDLSGCNIYRGDDLAQIVRSATSLKRLSLEWNSLGLARTGISALSSAIASNRSLKEVDLRSNRIGPSTAAALAHALRSNFSLICLDLRWNEIGPGGAAALLAMLHKNHGLTDVRLAGNGIPPSVQSQIDHLLEENRLHKPIITAFPAQDESPDSTVNSRNAGTNEMERVNLERISSLQKEIGNLRQELGEGRKELYELQLQIAAAHTQLETSRVELKEEHLLRKYVEKETGEMKLQLNKAKKQNQDLQEKMVDTEKLGSMKLSAVNAELLDSKERERRAQVGEAEASRECKHLKDQMTRLQEDSSARIQAAEERARSDADYSSSMIRRLESEIAQRDLKHTEDVEALRSKFTSQLKAAESAKEEYMREAERCKSAAVHSEARMATREQAFLQEKEAAQKLFDGRIFTLKADIATLQSQVEAKDKDIQKAKKRFAASAEDYENQISQLRIVVTKAELGKTNAEEKVVFMAAEQGKAQERLKTVEDSMRQLETKLEAERIKHSQALAKELANHLEDRTRLESEVLVTRRQIDSIHQHVKEIQSEQERRKFDTEKRVTGAETAVLEWIHQQFASLKSALIIQQHSVAGIG